MREIGIFLEGRAELPFHGTDEIFLRQIISDTLDYQNEPPVSVSLILTDDDEIREINSSYRGKDQPTDVISFASRDEPFPAAGEGPEELGDIYISLERAFEQAGRYEVSVKDEVKRLVIHGVLHLLGYDHEKSPEDDREMRMLEEKIFDSI